MAEYIQVESLKTEISCFYFRLEKAWSTITSFEKEAEKIIDQFQEHLQQAEICQRVDPGFLEFPSSIDPQKVKSQLLGRIYQKCLSSIILLESELDIITNEVLPELCEPKENASRIYESLLLDNPCSENLLDTPTSEHISLKQLFERLHEVDVAFKVKSDKMRIALQTISRLPNLDNDHKDGQVSSSNISIILDYEECRPSSSTLCGILSNYALGSSGISFENGTIGALTSDIIKPVSSDEELSNKMSRKISSQLLDAFTWTSEEKKHILYFLSQAEILFKDLGNSKLQSSYSRQSPAPRSTNPKKKK